LVGRLDAPDRLLDDPELVQIVHRAMLQRCPKSLTRGRLSTPAEVVLRLLVLKHLRNWSYAVLAREVRANLVYRQFTRIGLQTVPHPKTMGKLGLLLGPEVVQQLHRGLVARAQAEKVIRGRKMRVDTTVTETNIHYPTDSSLLGDGVRTLTRTMQRSAKWRACRREVAQPPTQCGPSLNRDRAGQSRARTPSPGKAATALP